MIHSRKPLVSIALALVALAGVSQSAQANLLANGSFENAVPGLPAGGYCYLGSTCSGPMPSWSGNVPVMASNNFPWGTPSGLGNWQPAFGAQQVGLQGSATVLSQNVVIGQASTLTLSWFDAGRRNYNDGIQRYTVSFDGVDLGTFTTQTAQAWSEHSLSFDVSGGGALQFRSLNLGTYDRTAFLDDIRLTAVASAVPEPASLAMALLGLVAVGGASRRKSVR